MKKIILAFLITGFTTASFAQNTTKQTPTTAPIKANVANVQAPQTPPTPAAAPSATDIKKDKVPQMKFETLELDYGTIKKSSEPFREFVVKNTGKAPLIISNAVGSCGCTIPTYPKEPIMPGKKASIKVRYDTERIGAFTKNITLTTNAPGQESLKLTIKGNVLTPETTGTTTTTPDPVKH